MTKGSDVKPVRRVLSTDEGDFVVELRERTIVIRPKRARRGGDSEVVVTPTSVYTRMLMMRAERERPVRRRRVSRSLLRV